jgi:hypothetical protein
MRICQSQCTLALVSLAAAIDALQHCPDNFGRVSDIMACAVAQTVAADNALQHYGGLKLQCVGRT